MDQFKGKRKEKIPLFLVTLLILLSLVIVLFGQYRTLKEQFVINGDVNIYIPPIYSLQDRSLFLKDYVTQYLLSRTTRGYIVFFILIGKFFDPVFLTKVLPFFFSVISVIVFFFVVRNIVKDDEAAFLASFLFILHSWTFYVFQGTGPRSFAYPLFLPFLYYLQKDKHLLCLWFYILQILFYTPVALISLTTFFILNLKIKNKKLYVTCSPLMLGTFFLLLPLLYFFLFADNSDKYFGPVVTWEQILHMPEFFTNGRDRLFAKGIIPFLQSHRSGVNFNASYVFLLLIFSGLLFFARKMNYNFRLSKEIRSLLISSFLLYVLAYIFLLKLFLPGRYLIFSIPIVICISIGVLLTVVFNCTGKTMAKNIILPFSIISLLIIYIPMISGEVRDYTYLRGAINYLSKSPVDSVIAASPHMAEPIPTFSKRRVLFSHEALLPFHLGYYTFVSQCAFDFFNAYYSDSLETLKNFCSKYTVDYFLFKRNDFSEESLQKTIYSEPFDRYIQTLIKERKAFAINSIEKSRIVFEEDGIVIIKTSDFR